MVSNINLSSPEVVEKKSLSGKPALALSAVLLVAMILGYAALSFMKSRYVASGKEMDLEIQQQQNKMEGPIYADAIDFQKRLNLLSKVADDHGYWDSLLKKMGSYVIPEVKFDSLKGKVDSQGNSEIDIIGTAQNLDAVSRELILLKTFPGTNSIEFKGANESTGLAGGQSGIKFDVSLLVDKKSLQK